MIHPISEDSVDSTQESLIEEQALKIFVPSCYQNRMVDVLVRRSLFQKFIRLTNHYRNRQSIFQSQTPTAAPKRKFVFLLTT